MSENTKEVMQDLYVRKEDLGESLCSYLLNLALKKESDFASRIKEKTFGTFQEFLECAKGKGMKERREFVECVALAWCGYQHRKPESWAVKIPICHAEESKLSWTEDLTQERTQISILAKC